jgi:hypothetical protein
MSKPNGAWSEHQVSDAPAPKPRPAAMLELIATVTLALSTLIAATVVSIGIARADVAGADLRLLAGSGPAPILGHRAVPRSVQ